MTITIQRTGKFWKLLKTLSYVPLLAGVGCVFALYMGDSYEPNTPGYYAQMRLAVIAGGLIFTGACMAIFARLGAWWFHG